MADRSGAVAVEGLRELRKFLRTLPKETQNELKEIHHKVAQPVYREAQLLVPRRSGTLAGSIRVAKSASSAAVIRAGKKSVPYAGVIHYGWPARNIQAQPFLLRSIRRRRPEVIKEYRKELNHLMLRVGKQTQII